MQASKKANFNRQLVLVNQALAKFCWNFGEFFAFLAKENNTAVTMILFSSLEHRCDSEISAEVIRQQNEMRM